MLAGVCGDWRATSTSTPPSIGLASSFSPCSAGPGIVIYAAAALVMPDEGKEDSVATAALRNRRDRPWPLIGLALVAIAAATLLSRATLWPHGDAWIVLLVAGGAILWITRHGTAAPTADASALATEDSRRVRRVFKGLAIAFGTIVALLLVTAAVFAAVFHVHVGSGVGDRNYVVAGVQDLQKTYKLGIGDMTVDLSNVRFHAGKTRVSARVDAGNLRVIVPDDVALRVSGDAQLGQVDLLGQADDGRNVDKSVDQAGAGPCPRRARRRRQSAGHARRTMTGNGTDVLHDEL